MRVGDWSDALAGALTLMVVAVGPEVASQALDDTFDRACQTADKKRGALDAHDRLRPLLHDTVSLNAAWDAMTAERDRNGALQATVEALMFSLRRGAEELTNPDVLHRLSQLSQAQLLGCCDRVQNFKPNIATA